MNKVPESDRVTTAVQLQGETMDSSSANDQQDQEQLEDPSWFDLSFGTWDNDTARDFEDESLVSQDVVIDDSNDINKGLFLEALPLQLHPAVSLGVRRVSSCYFSIQSASEASNSVADLLSLWDDNTNNHSSSNDSNSGSEGPRGFNNSEQPQDVASSCDNAVTNKELHVGSVGGDCNNADTVNIDETPDRGSILYHDIMMNVLSFLDAPSLSSFSQTARRPNFECFYYLQLQLQRELVVGAHPELQQHEVSKTSDHDAYHLPPMAGVGFISRLSQLDPSEARLVVQEYLDSNSTLRTMPLSHSLAYLRDLLRRNGFYTHMTAGKSPSKALASAALLMTLVGAASFMSAATSSSLACDASSSTMMMMTMMNKNADSLAEIPNMLFKVGLAGSIMNAARRSMSNHQTSTTTEVTANQDHASQNPNADSTTSTRATSGVIHMLSMRETAEQMAGMMQQLPNQLLHQLQAMQMRMMNGVGHSRTFTRGVSAHTMASTASTEGGTPNIAVALDTTTESNSSSSLAARMFSAFSSTSISSPSVDNLQVNELSLTSAAVADNWASMELLPLTPNPYEHLPVHGIVETVEEAEEPTHRPAIVETTSFVTSETATASTYSRTIVHRKLPSGCVGAFTRAVMRASTRMSRHLKEQRKARFAALTEEQQQQTASAWIDACSSDESLRLVREMVLNIDVDGFYVGSDGTETCALHAAAFSGAQGVLEFLCQGLDERRESMDGGLAFINLQDTNGWTALHFAAGANSVLAAQVLVKHGADLLVEAANGYTPIQWAQRLSNKEVLEELQRAECDNQQQLQHQTFPSFQQDYLLQRRGRRGTQLGSLTTIANRFFAMIPTHS